MLRACIQQYPGTLSVISINVAAHVAIHHIDSAPLAIDDCEANRLAVFTESQYSRVFKALIAHVDAAHLIYNTLHIAMYWGSIDTLFSRYFASSTTPFSTMATTGASVAATTASTVAIYLATGIAGVLTFLKFIPTKHAEVGDFCSLTGNSPAAYGAHALIMAAAPSMRIAVPCCASAGRYFAGLMGAIAVVPPLLHDVQRLQLQRKVEIAKQMKEKKDGHASPSPPFVVSSLTGAYARAIAGAALAGAAHFFAVQQIMPEGPTIAQSYATYVLFQRFTNSRIQMLVKGESVFGDVNALDDHLGHLGGAVAGAALGLLLAGTVLKNEKETQKRRAVDVALAVGVMLELAVSALRQ